MKCYERRSASPIKGLYRIVSGATLLHAIKGEAGYLRLANRRSAANSQCQLEVLAEFFFLLCFAY
jgi:hypothetical protein